VTSARAALTSTLAALVALGVLAGAGGAASKPKLTGSSLSPLSTYSAVKSVTGALAQTDPALLGRTDSKRVDVMIKYDIDGAASYSGGVPGLPPTSPAVTGKPLDDNQAAVANYVRHADQAAGAITSAVKAAVPAADIGTTFTTAYGGVSASVPANQIAALLDVNGVAAVQEDTLRQPADDGTSLVGATSAVTTLGGPSHAGGNVIVGVIDSGVWPEQPMLSPTGIGAPAGGPWQCQFGDGSDPALGKPFSCNDKLIGAYAFLDTYLALTGSDGQEFCDDAAGVCSARDAEGHGTATATIAAGDCVSSAVLYGTDRGPVCGVAPGAHVIDYRVCLSQGCYASDSVAAIQQAILDGVDVINFSVTGGADPYIDPVELAFLDAFDAGITVDAPAGNFGPVPGTTDHGGPWVTTVAASTGPSAYSSTLHLTADGGATFAMPGATITGGISSATPVVLAESLPGEDAFCGSQLAHGAAAGKVVLCERGGLDGSGAPIGRVDKGFNVLAGGAAGMVLYNPVDQDVDADNHWLPTIHVNGPPDDLLAFVGSHTNVKATWAPGAATPTTPDVLAGFSSRGPNGDFIKPDLTAPGIQVLSGMTPEPDETTPTNGPPDNLYQAATGTSFATPYATGVSILVKAAHPDWTPAEIKSALMTSSAQDVVEEDGTTPATPFDDGAGSIRADRALSPTLVFDENTADYAASAVDPLHRVDLNTPSIDATTMTGTETIERTATNVSGRDLQMRVATTAPDGATITVSDKAPKPPKPGKPAPPPPPDRLHVKKDGTTSFWVTIGAPTLPDGQYFGQITLTPDGAGLNAVTIPIAFVRQQGVVTLAHTCSPTTFQARRGAAHCSAIATNLGTAPANATLTVTNLDRGRGLAFKNVSAPAQAIKHDDGVQWSGTLSPSPAATVDAITPGGSPAGGYLPLAFFGFPAVPGVGDETISNFGTPTFFYGGEPYTSIGVVSDGYVVLGGGTDADVQSRPQIFPDPKRPNDVIAPWWTDLDPSAGGAIRVGTLSDGVDTWIVVDWDGVKNFGDSGTHSFEVWLRTGSTPDSEQVTMAYGDNSPGGDPASGSNWGAENRDGTSGQNLPSAPAPGSDFTIQLSGGGQPGGSATVTYDATANAPGTYRSVAAMTSDVTPGTTQAVQTLTATK
jgi:hypothetical protein